MKQLAAMETEPATKIVACPLSMRLAFRTKIYSIVFLNQ